ncbi:thiamine pyrophosphate-dependent enzyme [Planctomycetota bacterium]
MDRIPHIWCPSCGIGTAMSCFVSALEEEQLDLDKVCVVSGIGCTGRVAGYVKLDSYHTTHGRAIPFATGLKLSNPELKVVVFSGDGDLAAIGGNHLIHAARRNIEITVFCVNNFIYGMTGGQVAPTTPVTAVASTTPFGNSERPFNLPALAAACGVGYVSRWTVLHARRLIASMREAINFRGMSFVEIISPCPTLYTRKNKLGSGLDRMLTYQREAEIKHGADPRDVDIGMAGPIVCGNFVNEERPTFHDNMDKAMEQVLGADYRRIDLDSSHAARAERRAAVGRER